VFFRMSMEKKAKRLGIAISNEDPKELFDLQKRLGKVRDALFCLFVCFFRCTHALSLPHCLSRTMPAWCRVGCLWFGVRRQEAFRQ
jgi:hypothetical protein